MFAEERKELIDINFMHFPGKRVKTSFGSSFLKVSGMPEERIF
jgi:hypothetical protein